MHEGQFLQLHPGTTVTHRDSGRRGTVLERPQLTRTGYQVRVMVEGSTIKLTKLNIKDWIMG